MREQSTSKGRKQNARKKNNPQTYVGTFIVFIMNKIIITKQNISLTYKPVKIPAIDPFFRKEKTKI